MDNWKVLLDKNSTGLCGQNGGLLFINPAAAKWLEQRDIAYQYSMTRIHEDVPMWMAHGYLFEFQDVTAALLFKLTWG